MPQPRFQWTSPSLPLLTERWDPAVHMAAPGEWGSRIELGSLNASFSEGMRASPNGPVVPMWRPSHIQGLRLRPPTDFLLRPPPSTRYSLSPGDVLVSKFMPVQAAWASPSVPRYPPDANCIRVVGLPVAWGLWLAAVLSHSAFSSILGHMAAGLSFARLTMTDLRTLPIPLPPPDFHEIVLAWSEAAEAQVAAEQGIAWLVAEAQTMVNDVAPPMPPHRRPEFAAPAFLGDTLLPEQVALVAFEATLASAGWRSLGSLLDQEPARLREDLPPIRLLRLSDVDDDFSFKVPEARTIQQAAFRVYAQPLRADEVLLSTLGSSPKVLFHHPSSESTLWLPDTWARITVENAGAVALLLTTRQVRWQLARAATGAVRQFIGREELCRVRVPFLAQAEAERLHVQFGDLLMRRAVATGRLTLLRSQIDQIVASTIGAPS